MGGYVFKISQRVELTQAAIEKQAFRQFAAAKGRRSIESVSW
jgi:hypothetical protein